LDALTLDRLRAGEEATCFETNSILHKVGGVGTPQASGLQRGAGASASAPKGVKNKCSLGLHDN
jgi:hypothetical protein